MSPRDLPSRTLYQGRDRAAARSFLHAIGLTAGDIDKPFVGVSNCWLETMPCNFGLRELAAPLKAGIRAAGAHPMEFNTIAISARITPGTHRLNNSPPNPTSSTHPPPPPSPPTTFPLHSTP